ncbi:hypothetical protein [Anaerobacillus alkalilacustris]|nr:hypothetical protein [Anaerobacillus alkalilacustris]
MTEIQSRAQRIAEASEKIRIKSEQLRNKLRGDDYIADTSKDTGTSK